MNRHQTKLTSLLGAGLLAGCGPSAVEMPPAPEPPAVSRPAERVATPPPVQAVATDVTWETDRDRPFAEFIRDKSGGMLRRAAVGIAKGGLFQVVLDRSVAPDDTLDLTKSLMAGARKDFPDRPITLAVFDPDQSLILKARYKVGQGVKYEVAHDSKGGARPDDEATTASPAPVATRAGATAADKKFAEWAEEHGKAYLRYVEADLERHGRLWFGVTPEVKPADVPALTKSLLEGARKEFPKGDLVASVFDPDGNKIGKACLTGASSIRWER